MNFGIQFGLVKFEVDAVCLLGTVWPVFVRAGTCGFGLMWHCAGLFDVKSART